jgi:hypothetical protein
MDRWAVPEFPSGAKELGVRWSAAVRNSPRLRVTGSGSLGFEGLFGNHHDWLRSGGIRLHQLFDLRTSQVFRRGGSENGLLIACGPL